ncbi:MAG: hypothetical protein P8R54_17275, partial [Myxococcota bacterium]|nr:hypothetical protein [Myxococcota bacterium]
VPEPAPEPVSRTRPAASTPAPVAVESTPAAPTQQTPEPEPEPEVDVGSGEVSITGDAVAVTLQRGGRSFGDGSLPAGRYEIMATFSSDGQPISSGTVNIQTGELATVICRAAFMRCQVQ